MARLQSPIIKIVERMRGELTRIELAFQDPVEIEEAADAAIKLAQFGQKMTSEMQAEVDEHYANYKHS